MWIVKVTNSWFPMGSSDFRTHLYKELEYPNILRCILLSIRNKHAEVFPVFLAIVCGSTFWLIFSSGAQQALEQWRSVDKLLLRTGKKKYLLYSKCLSRA